MANGQNMSADDLKQSIVEAIASQFKIDSKFVDKLIDLTSKGLIEKFAAKAPTLAEKSKSTDSSKQTKQEAAKLPKVELALPKMLEGQLSKINDISKSLNKLIDSTATVTKENQFPNVLKKLLNDKSPDKGPEKSSFGILGNTLQKIMGSFKAPVKEIPEAVKVAIKSSDKGPEKSSFGILGNTLQKIMGSFKAPVKEIPEAVKVAIKSSDKGPEKSSFGILGNTLQKIIGSFKAPVKEIPEAVKVVETPLEGISKAAPVEQPAAPKSLLEEKIEAKPVIIAGISEGGIKDLSEHLPSIIKQGMEGLFDFLQEDPKKKKDSKFEFPGMGIIGGALGVLSTIGGLFTLLYGLQTEGPFKGLAKLVGKGMLAIGDALTKPLQNFIKNIGGMLIDIPVNMIKQFSGTIAEKIADITGALGKVGSSKLVAPIINFAKSIGAKIIDVPMKIIGSFGKSISGLFGKVGGSVAISGISKLSGFIGKFLGGFAKMFSKVPIVGSLISIAFAVSRFKSGDYVGGGIEILSALTGLLYATPLAPLAFPISLALDALNAFLDFKAGGIGEGKKGKGSMIMSWVGDMAKWVGQKLYKAITFFPIIGPALKSVEALFAGDWLEALKQFAYINPAFEFLGAMLGDESASNTTKVAAGFVGGAMNWVGEMGAFIGEKMLGLPIIGPAMKAVQALLSGDFSEALKQFVRINPLVGILESFLQTDSGKEIGSKVSGGFSKAKEFFSSIKNNILNKVLEYIPETIWGYPLRAKVAELFGIGPAAVVPESQPSSAGAPSEQAPPVKQVGDAKVKPDGGLVVSSPTEGSLYQLSKNDGIVAGPVTDDASAPGSSSKSSAANLENSDKILIQIANNTEATNKNLAGLAIGFNMLAKSLEKLGVSVAGQSPTVINNVSKGGGGSSSRISSSQIASMGNSTISNFRSGVEASRFVPA
jgi:hypothetical protein